MSGSRKLFTYWIEDDDGPINEVSYRTISEARADSRAIVRREVRSLLTIIACVEDLVGMSDNEPVEIELVFMLPYEDADGNENGEFIGSWEIEYV